MLLVIAAALAIALVVDTVRSHGSEPRPLVMAGLVAVVVSVVGVRLAIENHYQGLADKHRLHHLNQPTRSP